MIVLLVLLVLFLLYLLSLQGRRNHPGMAELHRWRYAHRGLHNAQRPENSMAAFRAALDGGFGIEFDLHLLKDGNLGVMHDSDLLRTTGQAGKMEDLTTEDLKNYHLQGSDQTIPQFQDVLELFDGKAPLIIELKSVGGNYAQLTKTACEMLEGYKGPYCIESFDPFCIRWLRQNRPDIIRGQLAYNSLKDEKAHYPLLVRFITSFYLENFLTRPDFLAHHFEDRKNLSVFLCRKLWGITAVSWTLKTREMFDTAEKEGWIPIFEGFTP